MKAFRFQLAPSGGSGHVPRMEFPATSATVHRLPSGLTLILDPDADSEVISTQFWVETGSMHESALAGAGLSHLLEHMVFKGSKNFSGEELATRVQAAGGQWNAYTSFDRTVYYIDGPATSLAVFLSTLAELVFRPTFPVEDYEREKDVIRREIDMGNDDPDSVSSHLLFSTFFQHDNRRHPVIGHRALFDEVTHDEMVAYHAARYRPSNVFVVISGGFDAEEAEKLVQAEIEKGLPARKEFPVILPAEAQALAPRNGSLPFDIPSTHLTLAWQIPGLDHDDTPALEILATVLGSGRSTPLYREIREKQDLAFHIGSYAWTPPHGPGMFAVYAETPPEKCEKLQAAILAEIEKITQADLADALKRAVRKTAASQFKSLTTASGRASDLASNWHQTRNLDFTRDYLFQIETLTPADLQRVAKKWLSPKRLTRCTLLPEAAFSKKAKKAHKALKNSLKEHRLSNGLRVILQQDPRVPVVYTEAAILTGAHAETSATAGLNALLATLQNKGTQKKSSLEIAEFLENRGASINAGSGNNTNALSSFCLSEDLGEVLPLFTEILTQPSFPAETLERERAAHLADLSEARQDPAQRAFLELRQALWGKTAYGLPTSGTPESIKRLERNDLLTHHAAYFHAGNMALSVFGDLDPTKTLDLLEENFASLATQGSVPNPLSPPAQNGEKHIALDKQQAVLAIGYPGFSATDSRRFALSLIDNYCSDMAGPLFSRIREELGLAYYVASTTFYGLDTGLFAFYMGTSPDQLDLARRELSQQIQLIAENGIPDEALQRVKANARASQALRNQSPRSRAKLCALDTLVGLAPDHHLQLAAKSDAVTADEIRSCAKELFLDQKPQIITVTP